MSTIDWIIVMLRHTPVWVFPLIAVVLAFGLINLRRRTVPVWTLTILPVVMLGLSLANMIGTAAVPPLAAASWLVSTAVGTAIGWFVTAAPLTVDHASRRIRLTGSAVPLIVVLAIVVLRYTFGYMYGIHPELRADPSLAVELIAAGAVFTGVTFGRYGKLGWWYRDAARRVPA